MPHLFRTAPLLMAFTISSDASGKRFFLLQGTRKADCQGRVFVVMTCVQCRHVVMLCKHATLHHNDNVLHFVRLSRVRHESCPSRTLLVCWLKTNPAVQVNRLGKWWKRHSGYLSNILKLSRRGCKFVRICQLLASHILRCKMVMLHLRDLYHANHNSANRSIANHMSIKLQKYWNKFLMPWGR